MKSKKYGPEIVTRDSLLNILNAEELARAGTRQTAASLTRGDEFIDLAQIDRGVQRAGDAHPAEDVLPRKAVHEHTWLKIVANLNARKSMVHVPSPSRRPR